MNEYTRMLQEGLSSPATGSFAGGLIAFYASGAGPYPIGYDYIEDADDAAQLFLLRGLGQMIQLKSASNAFQGYIKENAKRQLQENLKFAKRYVEDARAYKQSGAASNPDVANMILGDAEAYHAIVTTALEGIDKGIVYGSDLTQYIADKAFQGDLKYGEQIAANKAEATKAMEKWLDDDWVAQRAKLKGEEELQGFTREITPSTSDSFFSTFIPWTQRPPKVAVEAETAAEGRKFPWTWVAIGGLALVMIVGFIWIARKRR